MKSTDRRTFLQQASAAALLLGAGKLVAHPGSEEKKSGQSVMLHRPLGKTGLKMSLLGFGAMRTSDPAVIRQGIDQGINNIDTARRYMDGHNEEIVATAMGDLRKKLVVTTKIPVGQVDRMRADVEASLTALNSDYIDILLLHALKRDDEVNNAEWMGLLAELKKAGKIRFAGFSTHSNMAALLRTAITNKFYDVVLTAYNFKADQDLALAISEASKAGIGVIAMKTQAGGYTEAATEGLNPHQAALKWALNHDGVSCAIPSMVTFEQLQENLAIMGEKFGWMDRKTLHRYGQAIDKKLCRLCGQCAGACQAGVAISDIQRCLMYAEGYRDESLALRTYAEIGTGADLTACRNCPGCQVTCPHGVEIAANLARAMQRFA